MEILDLFNKRLELKKSHSTWNEYQCPICSEGTVKLNKKDNKYKNYNCNCDTKRITAIVFKGSGYKKTESIKEIPVIIPEIPNLLNVRLSLIGNVSSVNELQSKYESSSNTVSYLYSSNQRTLRINKTKSTGKKIIFPQVILGSSSWMNGIGDTIFPIFTNLLTLKERSCEVVSFRPCFRGELIVAVEGEKCVEYLQSQNIECFTILNAYGHNLEKIKLAIGASKNFIPNLKQLLYIPDLDPVGIKKAIVFQQASWSLGIPCKIFDIRDKLLAPIGKGIHFDKGYDIADYVEENLNGNLVEVLENEFSSK